MSICTLMNKNKEILDFEYDVEEHMVTSIDLIYKENEKYAPLGLIKDGNVNKIEFTKWWKNRQIPASRLGLREVLKECDISDIDNFDLLELKAYSLSLSDQYWVKTKGKAVSWEKINFFDNDFSEDVGKLLIGEKVQNIKFDLNTPDMTSNGNYEKRWKIINKERYLVKAGGKILNQEPFNELIATKLYERILEPNEYVKYELVNEKNRAVSICKNFITKDTELVPAWKINEYFEKNENEDKYEHYIQCLNKLGIKNAREKIDKMIVCDYIIANKDRHFNNFGAIRNVNTLEFIDVAPIFDNGCSLWFDENDLYVGEFFLTKPFEEYEKSQLGLVKDFKWLDVEKLDGFTQDVKEILQTNQLLTKERIEKICIEVQKRIDYIKSIA